MPFNPLSTGARRHAAPLLTALAGGLIYAVWQPPSTDLAAQEFRASLFERVHFGVWSNLWFGGHHLPGYSLAAPVLGWLLGPLLLGVLATVAVALAGSLLCHEVADHTPTVHSPALGAALLTLGSLASLFGGRIAFVLGTAFAVVALYAAVRGSGVFAVAGLAFVSTASSPVAGMFLAVIGCALWLSVAVPRRVAVGLVAPPLILMASLAVLFPDGGDFPFPIGGALNALIVTAVIAAAGWRFMSLRWACAGYAGLCVLVIVFDTPVGGNAARLAALAAPVLVVMLTRRIALVVALLIPLIVLQWSPISLAITGDRDQTEAGFYRPLIETLASLPQPLRAEVVPVASHDESNVVARQFPIARGWNRQIDRKYNALFFDDRLDPDDYLAWLIDNGVSVVAIADTELDYAGKLEAELLVDPPSYLEPIYVDEVWRVFRVVPVPALADHGAAVTAIDVGSFTVDVPAATDVEVKVRFSPWFSVSTGDACVAESQNGWTVVRVRTAGEVTVSARFSLAALIDRDGDC